MALLTIQSDDTRQLQKFELKCKKCNSTKCRVEIDWAAYPSASWNNTSVICEECHEEEIIFESN